MQAFVVPRILQAFDIQQVRAPVRNAGRLSKPGQEAMIAWIELNIAAVATAIRTTAVDVDGPWLAQTPFGDIRACRTNGREHGMEQRNFDALTQARFVA